MQKFIGSLLIISATTGAGILYGSGLKENLKKMLYLRYVISLIKGQLEYAGAPLGHIFEHLSWSVSQPYKGWFSDMAEQIENRKKKSFSEIWSDSADKKLACLGLKKQYMAGLKSLGSYIDGREREATVTILSHYLAQLDHETDTARADMHSKKKLGNCIGVTSGIFLVILLI